MRLTRPVADLAPVPHDIEYLGTLADRVYYHYGGVIWAWTALAWYGVCLLTDWPRHPEARAIAAQGRYAEAVPCCDERPVPPRLKERTA